MPNLEQRLRIHGHRLDQRARPVGLAEIEQRLGEGPADPPVAARKPVSRAFGWQSGPVFGVAAALVLLVGFGLPLLLNGTGRPPASDTDIANLEVANAFMDAWVAGDGEAVADMFNADGTFEGWLVGPDQIPALHDWFRAVGWTFQDRGCALATEPGQVDCAYTMEDDLLRALGRPSATGSLVLGIDSGEIQDLSDVLGRGYLDTWETFIEWLERGHPDDFAAMFYPDGFNPLLEPASIALWESYTDDESLNSFVSDAQQSLESRRQVIDSAEATAEAFMAAWAAGEGETAAALFMPTGVYGAGVTDPTDLGSLHDWYRAVGWDFQDLGCAVGDVSTPDDGAVYIECAFIGENDLGRALGWPQMRDTFRLVVGDAGISLATEHHGVDTYRDLLFTFKDWVGANHPNDLEKMFLYPDRPWPGPRHLTMDPPFEALNAYPLLNADSIALWDRHITEFASSPEAVDEAMKDLEVATYVAEAAAVCRAAEAEFESSVTGLMRSDTENFQQFYVDFPDLQSLAEWHETRARHADLVMARLRDLAVPDQIADSVERLFVLMEDENDLTRQVAAAARAGDQQSVDKLIGERVDATHGKDHLAFGIGYDIWSCPVSSGGA